MLFITAAGKMYSAERSQIFVVNWRKSYTIRGVKAVPVGFVGGVIEKRNIVNLDGGGDDGSIDKLAKCRPYATRAVFSP